MKKIFIVEDDEKLRGELQIFLSNNGYECSALTEFSDIINSILAKNPDLLLLDLTLPGNDGHFICRELRKVSDIPIIIMTSRNNEIDELTSLNFGADNYVTKPFNLQILLARIANLLRRADGSSSDIIQAGSFSVNIAKSTITTNGKTIELTKNEFRIMKCLLQNKDKIVSREKIMQFLWDDESFVDDNTLAVNMTRLRRKLEEAGLGSLIKTRRGQGYILSI